MSSSTSDAADAVREARQRLRSSLDALSDQLSPAGALDLARSFIENREARDSAVDFVKKNPVPTGLAATGLIWLGYSLLKRDTPQLAEPGLTEVPGHAAGAERAPIEPTHASPARRDVPHAPAPPAGHDPRPAPEPTRTEKVVETARGVRSTFRRHPLLYGVVGLVTGAVVGVIAALRGRREEALEAPDEVCADAPDEAQATYAAGEPVRARRGGNGVRRARSSLRPGAPAH